MALEAIAVDALVDVPTLRTNPGRSPGAWPTTVSSVTMRRASDSLVSVRRELSPPKVEARLV
jgi:hypothetical protein